MKIIIKSLLIFVVAVSILSFSALAKKTESNTSTPLPQENKDHKESVTVIINGEHASKDNCIILNDLSSNELIKEFNSAEAFPLIIDLNEFGTEIDSLVISKELFDFVVNLDFTADTEETKETNISSDSPENTTLITPEIESFKAEQKEPEKEIPETLNEDEFVLKVLMKDKECSWKRKSLIKMEAIEDRVKLVFDTSDHTDFLNVKTSSTKASETTVKLTGAKNNSYGVLLVSKDNKDKWSVESEYLFGSKTTYFVAIAFLIALTFVIIVLIDLLIIKLYKMKK